MEGRRWLLCVFIFVVGVGAAMVVDHPGTVAPRRGHYSTGAPRRSKRSPFILAFQVTRPPGMFQMSLRRPYIFNMMGNLTNMIMTSNLTTFLRRSFLGTPVVQSTSESTSDSDGLKKRSGEVESRQEDLLIYD